MMTNYRAVAVRAFGVVVAAASAMGGCSAETVEKPSPPAPLTYAVDFNTQANAIWIELLEVTALSYDAATYSGPTGSILACDEIMNRARTGQRFDPEFTELAKSPDVTPCEVSEPGSTAAQLNVPFDGASAEGDPIAVLAIGKNNATPGRPNVQIGCGAALVKADAPVPAVTAVLERFSSLVQSPPPAPANCQRLKDKCDNGNRCPSN
jgi:hypothetical protein